MPEARSSRAIAPRLCNNRPRRVATDGIPPSNAGVRPVSPQRRCGYGYEHAARGDRLALDLGRAVLPRLDGGCTDAYDDSENDDRDFEQCSLGCGTHGTPPLRWVCRRRGIAGLEAKPRNDSIHNSSRQSARCHTSSRSQTVKRARNDLSVEPHTETKNQIGGHVRSCCRVPLSAPRVLPKPVAGRQLERWVQRWGETNG